MDSLGRVSSSLPGVCSVVCADLQDLLAARRAGSMRRVIFNTLMGLSSCRAHSIFTVEVVCTDEATAGVHRSRLQLVDMACSEDVTTSLGAGGPKLDEKACARLGQSVTCFSSVVEALAAGAQHVKYRNSKLTRLLRTSLGGRAHCLVLATVSAAAGSLCETRRTLRLASRLQQVTNFPGRNDLELLPGWGSTASENEDGPHEDARAGGRTTDGSGQRRLDNKSLS